MWRRVNNNNKCVSKTHTRSMGRRQLKLQHPHSLSRATLFSIAACMPISNWPNGLWTIPPPGLEIWLQHPDLQGWMLPRGPTACASLHWHLFICFQNIAFTILYLCCCAHSVCLWQLSFLFTSIGMGIGFNVLLDTL